MSLEYCLERQYPQVENYIRETWGDSFYDQFLDDLMDSDTFLRQKWDGRTDSNSQYYLLRQRGLSHSEAVQQIVESE